MAKLTDIEIKRINDLKGSYNQLVETLGGVEIQLISILTKKEQLKVDLLEIQKEELIIARFRREVW